MRLLTARRVGTCGCSQLSSNPATCLHLHRRGWPSFRIYMQDEAAGTGRRRSSRVPGAVTHLSDCLLGGGPTAHWRGRLHPGAEDCALRPAQALLLKNDSDPCPAAGSPGHDERSRAPNNEQPSRRLSEVVLGDCSNDSERDGSGPCGCGHSELLRTGVPYGFGFFASQCCSGPVTIVISNRSWRRRSHRL